MSLSGGWAWIKVSLLFWTFILSTPLLLFCLHSAPASHLQIIRSSSSVFYRLTRLAEVQEAAGVRVLPVLLGNSTAMFPHDELHLHPEKPAHSFFLHFQSLSICPPFVAMVTGVCWKAITPYLFSYHQMKRKWIKSEGKKGAGTDNRGLFAASWALRWLLDGRWRKERWSLGWPVLEVGVISDVAQPGLSYGLSQLIVMSCWQNSHQDFIERQRFICMREKNSAALYR